MANISKWKATYAKGEVKYFCDECWRGIGKHNIELASYVSNESIPCTKCLEREGKQATVVIKPSQVQPDLEKLLMEHLNTYDKMIDSGMDAKGILTVIKQNIPAIIALAKNSEQW